MASSTGAEIPNGADTPLPTNSVPFEFTCQCLNLRVEGRVSDPIPKAEGRYQVWLGDYAESGVSRRSDVADGSAFPCTGPGSRMILPATVYDGESALFATPGATFTLATTTGPPLICLRAYGWVKCTTWLTRLARGRPRTHRRLHPPPLLPAHPPSPILVDLWQTSLDQLSDPIPIIARRTFLPHPSGARPILPPSSVHPVPSPTT